MTPSNFPPGAGPLGHQQELFDFLLENTPDQIYFKDREGRFLCVSRAVADFMGATSPADLVGKTDFDFWGAETAQEAWNDEQRIMETGEKMVGKIEKCVHPDGTIAWDYTSKLPLRNSRGEIIGICGINKDFSAVKRLEDELAAERDRLRVLTAELEAKNAHLQADLQMAREIQEALLPEGYPTVAGCDLSKHLHLVFAHCYRPAAAVGGDFFDIFPLSQNQAGVFICDVMGHGLRAALITAIIRGLLEELRPVMADPGRFLSALNMRLRSILKRVEEPFVATAFYMIADMAANEVRFANAGHPNPVRIVPGKGTAEPLATGKGRCGPALGLFDSASYMTACSPFGPDHRIVLFTDGVYEVDSPKGEEFGLESLITSFGRHANLSADKLFAAVLDDIGSFASKGEFDDDVCLVAVERVGEP